MGVECEEEKDNAEALRSQRIAEKYSNMRIAKLITASSFLCAIFEQVLQLRHELLHVLEIHIHRCKAYVGDFVQFLQPVHDHLADLGGGEFALSGFVDHAFDVIDDRFELGRWHGPFFASLQQSLQNLLTLET